MLPPPSIHSKQVQGLIRRLKTPPQAQKWIHSLRYNTAETIHTLDWVVQSGRAHCLEAALAAAAILEHHGYPPLILDLESADYLDHTLFLYQHHGRYGTVGMSRDIGLYGRRPVYRNIYTVARSYAAPYIDAKAQIKRYGVLDLRTLKRSAWRTSRSNVWYVEEALRTTPHQRLVLSSTFIRTWRQRYVDWYQHHPREQPDFYPNQRNWA